MIQDEELERFFDEFLGEVKDLRSASKFCRNFCLEKRKNASHNVKLPATALWGVFCEIDKYLDYYETEFSSKGGFSYEVENERVRRSTLELFLNNIRAHGPRIDLDDSRSLIEKLIINWDNLSKEAWQEVA